MYPPPVVEQRLEHSHTRLHQVKGVVVHCMGEYVRLSMTEGGRVPAWDFLARSPQLAGGKLSAHCLVSPGGTIVRCVSDDQGAYHAGVSKWREWNNLNAWFLGIELLLPGDWAYGPFKTALMDGSAVFPGPSLEAAAWQVATWVETHAVGLDNVVRHSDVAGDGVRGEGRGKLDPGTGLDWTAFMQLVQEWRTQFHLEVRDDD